MTVTVPERSFDQRMEALRKANVIRSRRAQLKRDLKAGRIRLADMVAEPPGWLADAKLFDMLLSVPKCGNSKATKMIKAARVAASKTIGGLSDRQRTDIINLLEAREVVR